MSQKIAKFLNIKEFPFEIFDSDGNLIYCENSDGDWYKRKFDANGNLTYRTSSDGGGPWPCFSENSKFTYYEN